MSRFSRWVNIIGLVFLLMVIFMVSVNFMKRNVYDSSLGINILLIAKDGMGIVSVRDGGELMSLTRLPDNLLIPIEPGGAEYRVEAFYKVGLPVKNELLVSRISVGQALGVILSGVIMTREGFSLYDLSKALWSLSTKTNLSIFDRYSLYKDMGGILARKTSFEISFPTTVVDRVTEPDGKEVQKLNSSIFVWSKNQWVSEEVLSETAEVVLVNGSGQEGKARLVAKQLETAGVRIIELSVAKKQTKECLIWDDAGQHPKTFSFLKNSFSCKRIEKEVLFDFLEGEADSDLVVVLGI